MKKCETFSAVTITNGFFILSFLYPAFLMPFTFYLNRVPTPPKCFSKMYSSCLKARVLFLSFSFLDLPHSFFFIQNFHFTFALSHFWKDIPNGRKRGLNKQKKYPTITYFKIESFWIGHQSGLRAYKYNSFEI